MGVAPLLWLSLLCVLHPVLGKYETEPNPFSSSTHDQVYAFGGSTPDGTLYVYSLPSDTWDTRVYTAPPDQEDKPDFDFSGYALDPNGGYCYEGLEPHMLPFSGRNRPVLCALDGRLMVLGGGDQYCNPVLGGVSVYDPDSDTWGAGALWQECGYNTPHCTIGDTLYADSMYHGLSAFSFTSPPNGQRAVSTPDPTSPVGHWTPLLYPSGLHSMAVRGSTQAIGRLMVTVFKDRVRVLDTVSLGVTWFHGCICWEPNDELVGSEGGASLLIDYTQCPPVHIARVREDMVYPCMHTDREGEDRAMWTEGKADPRDEGMEEEDDVDPEYSYEYSTSEETSEEPVRYVIPSDSSEYSDETDSET
ncbi:hypothetical protein KIPB_002423 [Kipferlia bialata]|uniref:Uncharacterized protein n=1 Tax=Kipferlia bialata TaxID=797122 RepID=A0A9K3GFY7_9EUKA|nr:hypothetical protein KIPB_002423 [Kipferlia bialata]|eukprot:g2423.t1